jgi:two-component system nitrogen regulation sensor histidine kinase NtrY
MIREMNDMGISNMERQMRVAVEDKVMTVLVNLNALRDSVRQHPGLVAVLDDLTHLLKTQRMLAWKRSPEDSARDQKPAYPIKLSAQRLGKIPDKFSEDGNAYDDHHDHKTGRRLKTLVNEFSSLPGCRPQTEPERLERDSR